MTHYVSLREHVTLRLSFDRIEYDVFFKVIADLWNRFSNENVFISVN